MNIHEIPQYPNLKEILSRVINTMMNSLINNGAMMDRIIKNKGVDADNSLRDKLKVYAAEKQSCIALMHT